MPTYFMDVDGTLGETWNIAGTAESWETGGGSPPIELDVALISASSTEEVPVGARISVVEYIVTTPYDNSATLPTIIDGTSDLTLPTLPATAAAVAGTYKYQAGWTVESGQNGPLNVAPTGTPSAGACTVILHYAKATVA